ncbi:INO80 complex subunit E isoform X1 [Varanus komodoensis]|uniref:INO80 complex subunit E N-terminal domain-containing protein n=1 Tax=Varanus komodoensis TaxID=61221 RepID=A0A8D2KTU4_VARKO|nr:INO80 complex subunit E isoform X1 [Varanus komodoensis]
MNGAGEPDPGGGGYKRRYRALKRRLKFLIYEQECFQEELRKAQRKLLKVSRDKSFLLDRLLQYENVDEESSDSDATASSDNSDGEMPKGTEPQSLKRKRSPQLGSASSPSSSGLSLQPTSGFGLPASGTQSPYLTSLASPPYAPFPSDYLALGAEPGPPQPDTNATRSARRPPRPRKPKLPLPPASPTDCSPVVVGLPFPSPRGTPKLPPPTILSTVPHQMFSDAGEGSGEDPLDGDDELVIDIPE